MTNPAIVAIGKLVEEIYVELGPRFAAQRIEARTDIPAELSVWADFGQLRQAIVHLASSALDGMPCGGNLCVTALTGPHGVELEVADSGPGLSDEVRRRGFRAPAACDAGAVRLLREVSLIAAANGGNVRAINCPEGGAAFILQFPQPQPQQKPRAAA